MEPRRALDAGLLRFADGNRIGTGGFVETPNQRLVVQHVLPIVTPNDLAQVAIASETASRAAGGRRARRQGHAAAGRRRGRQRRPGLLLIVEKYPWGNTLDVTRGVEDGAQGDAARPARRSRSTPGLPCRNFIDTSIHNLTVSL
jgi:hypothetical protein